MWIGSNEYANEKTKWSLTKCGWYDKRASTSEYVGENFMPRQCIEDTSEVSNAEQNILTQFLLDNNK